VAECGWRSCKANVTSVSDAQGLVFSPRIAYSPTVKLWEFYAISSSPLVNDNISVVFDLGWATTQAFAVRGTHYNMNLPATSPCSSLQGIIGPNTCSVSFTSSYSEFVFSIVAINDADACTVTPGFTQIASLGVLEVDYYQGQAGMFTCSGTDPTSLIVDGVSNEQFQVGQLT
jgi:hypothetical protein